MSTTSSPTTKVNMIDLSGSKLLRKHLDLAERIGTLLNKAYYLGATTEARHLMFICNHYDKLTPDIAQYWFDLSALQNEIETSQARSAEKWHDWRNRLSLLPLILTWAALSLAVFAYQQDLRDHPGDLMYPFLLLWQNGFHHPISLSFAVTALLDVVLLVSYLLCLVIAQRKEQKAYTIAAKFVQENQSTFDELIQTVEADHLPSITSEADVDKVAEAIKDVIDKAVEESATAIKSAKEAFETTVAESKMATEAAQKTFNEAIEASKLAIKATQETFEVMVKTSAESIEEAKETSRQFIEETRETSRLSLEAVIEASQKSITAVAETSKKLLTGAIETSRASTEELTGFAKESITAVIAASQESTYELRQITRETMEHIAAESKRTIDASDTRMAASDKRMQDLFDVHIGPMMVDFHKDVGMLQAELKNYQARLDLLTESSQKLADSSETLGSNVESYSMIGRAINEQIAILSKTEQEMLGEIKAVAAGIDGSVKSMQLASGKMQIASESMEKVTTGLSKEVTETMNTMTRGTKEAVTTMTGGIQTTVNTMTSRVKRATDALNQTGNALYVASDLLQITSEQLQRATEDLAIIGHPGIAGDFWHWLTRRRRNRRKAGMAS